jgi:ribosomal 50S subunit-recycling heat shock protein
MAGDDVSRLLRVFYMTEHSMRLDKYLKVSRIIKRRVIAKEACDGGLVTLNGRAAKAGSEVKAGDIMEIRFGNRVGRYEILDVREVVRKENAAAMYKVLEEDAEVRAGRA